MNFTIPTNWQRELTSSLLSRDKKREVKEMYGKLALDDVGGGRPASSLAFISRRGAEREIKNIQKAGFKFNYLLNAVCMDNLEFTRIGQRMFRRLLDWLVKIRVDSVTVASPYLLMWIKKNYPSLSLTASIMSNIDSLKRAKYWEDLGVDKITFPGPVVNRNFKFIRLLRKSISCKIQLIANTACIHNCPDSINHSLMNAHASQRWHKSKAHVLDYHIIMCRLKRLQHPVNFIRSDWIRPEDIYIYEDMGIDSIKLIDRRLPTNMILKITKAYLNRSYRGNLLDLFPAFQGKSFNVHRRWVNKLLHLGNPLYMNLFRMARFSKFFSQIQVYIDNKELDGFIEGMPKDCDLISCERCGYCEAIAKKAVRLDKDYLESTIVQYKDALDELF